MKNEITLNEHEGMSITEEMAIKQGNNILNWKTADRDSVKSILVQETFLVTWNVLATVEWYS